MPPAPALSRPIELGPFEIRRFLGRGGMGDVWRGVHVEQQVPVAVKALRPRYFENTTHLETFRNEVRRVAQFHHPGIVLVFDYGTVPAQAAQHSAALQDEEAAGGHHLEQDSPYLVMEYCDGGSLRDRVANLPWLEIRRVLLALLDALAHAHARGFVHRDIKPENTLFSSTASSLGQVKLADFGIAIGHRSDPEDDDGISGTPAYMAPEQFGDKRQQGPWTDLYAVGCVAYELATGRRPFAARRALELAAAHLHDPPPPPELRSGVPEALEPWLLRLLAKPPHQRYACAADAARDLAELQAHGPREPSYSTTGLATLALQDPEEVDSPDPDAGAPDESAVEHGGGGSAFPDSWRDRSEERPPMSLIGAGLGLYAWRTVPLVDRDAERDRIWDALREVAADGKARAALLRGEVGLGKTRLATWIAQRALELGVATDLLQAEHAPIPGPGHGLRAMLADHLRCVGLPPERAGDRVRDVLARHDCADWYLQQGLVRFLTSDDAPETEAQTPAERYAAVARLLALMCRDRPVLLLLRDVQWGSDALGFVQHLLQIREERPLPLLVLMTLRDDQLGARPLEAAMVDELGSLPGLDTLALGPLAEADQRELVQRLLRLEGDLARQVRTRSGGNPLFATQLVGDWVGRGVLQVGATGFELRPGDKAPIPATIHSLWQDRLGRALADLPPEARPALEVAAALGRRVRQDEWEAACAQRSLPLPRALREALLRVNLAAHQEGGWTFAHELLRESVQRDAELEDRWGGVNEACAAMLRDAGPRRGTAERVGRHLVEAGQLEEAVEPLLEGARERLATSDYRDAGELADAAGDVLTRLSAGPRDERWGAVWLVQARACFGRGAYEEAARHASKAAEGARRNRWRELHAPALRYQAMTLIKKGELGLAETVLARAQLEAGRVRDRWEEARCLLHQATVCRMLGDLERAAELADEAHGHFAEMADRRGRAAALTEAGNALLASGRGADALEPLQQALTLCEEIGNPFGVAAARNSLAEVHRQRGDLEAAETQYTEALAIGERIGSGEAVVPRLNLALVQLRRGDPAAARPALEAALPRASGGRRWLAAYLHPAMTLCAALDGDWPAFDRHAASAAEIVAETGAVDEEIAWLTQRAGTLALDAGELDRADAALRLARDQWDALRQDEKVAEVEQLLD